MKDIRLTIALPSDQHALLRDLAQCLDVDQGKAVRWMMKTLVDIVPVADCNACRSKLTPQAIYLLDSLSKIIK